MRLLWAGEVARAIRTFLPRVRELAALFRKSFSQKAALASSLQRS